MRLHTLLVLTGLSLCSVNLPAQTATWSGSGGNTDWNNALNWDLGVPAEGTNALIGVGGTADYTSPMVAGSFGGLTLNGVLNVSASGMVLGASGNSAALVSGTGAKLFINSGGVMSLTNGAVQFTNSAAGSVAVGGELRATGTILLGGSVGVGFLTNSGGTISAGGLTINPNGVSSSAIGIINGGTNNLGVVRIRRAGPSSLPGLGTDGLVINGGVVNMTGLTVNDNNSYGTMYVTGGATTNTGSFIVGQQNNANNRASRFVQTGGTVVSTFATGVRVAVNNGNQTAHYSIMGGTNLVERLLIGDATNGAPGVTVLVTNAGRLFVGSGGIVTNNPTSYTISLNNGGLTGATADWSTGLPLLLNGGTHTFQAADLAGTAHNITLAGVVRGNGALNKNGAGTLTLAGTNIYTGVTTVSEGSLVLAATGSISNSMEIAIADGAVFDVSAVSGAALLGGQILSGKGTVIGNLAVLGGSTIRPGGLLAPGRLSVNGSLAQSGLTTMAFDISDDSTGTTKTNDQLVIAGDLVLSGTNTVQVNGLDNPLPAGAAYKLISYTGTLTGNLDNLARSGAGGSLSNDVAGKAIYFITKAPLRPAADIVWVGGRDGNAWNLELSTNWLNGLNPDLFVSGDRVRFDATGAANPVVNVVGSLDPASLVVDAPVNYTWAGSGSIDGGTGLVKTNTGTLSVQTTNGYVGPTIIGGGVLEVVRLANGGLASSLGTSTSASTNLQFLGGSLRYTGLTASTDRSAEMNEAGAGIDIANASSSLTVSGVISGPGTLTKSGPGTLVLPGPNSYTNGTVVSGGTLQIGNTGSLSTGPVTNNGATLRVATGTSSTIVNPMNVTGAVTLDLNNTGGDTHLTGAWSGDGNVTVINQQSASRTLTLGGNGNGGGNMLDFSGTINMGTNNGFLRFNDSANFNYGSTRLTLDLGTGSAIFLVRNGGVTIDIGALRGGPNTRVQGRASGSSGTVTYSIGGKGLSTTFEGGITNSASSGNPTAVTKVGAGTLTLSGVSSYTGVTVVNEGVLAFSGAGALNNTPSILLAGGHLDATARTDGTLSLRGGQTLFGEGNVAGGLTIRSNATVSVGAAAGIITQLSVSGALTCQPGGVLNLDADHNSGTNDVISGMTSVAYGGTLNLNLSSVEPGSSFKLFSAGAYSGMFGLITPTSPLVGYVWDVSSLAVNGTLKLKPLVVTHPTVAGSAVVGTNLTITGSGGPPFYSYTVYASPDLSIPLDAWTQAGTGNFAADGSFVLTIGIDPVTFTQMFYSLRFTAP